jgi:hypothetical protein
MDYQDRDPLITVYLCFVFKKIFDLFVESLEQRLSLQATPLEKPAFHGDEAVLLFCIVYLSHCVLYSACISRYSAPTKLL